MHRRSRKILILMGSFFVVEIIIALCIVIASLGVANSTFLVAFPLFVIMSMLTSVRLW